MIPWNPYSTPSAVVTARTRYPHQPPIPAGFLVRTPVTWSSGMTVTPSPPAAAFLIARRLRMAFPAPPPIADPAAIPSHPIVWNKGRATAA